MVNDLGFNLSLRLPIHPTRPLDSNSIATSDDFTGEEVDTTGFVRLLYCGF